MKTLRSLLIVVVLALAAGFGWLAAGGMDFAADVPHAGAAEVLIGWARNRSVHMRAADIVVPKLDDPSQFNEGAEHYVAMCEGCHLAPGKNADEFIQGLYPMPPNLAQVRRSPAEQFWIIKHGVKGSAMPAWGGSHDDTTIWEIVAFLQKLPDLTPQQYGAASAPLIGAPSEEPGHQTENNPQK